MFFFLICCEVSRHKILGIILRPDRTANNGCPAARGPYCSDKDLALLAPLGNPWRALPLLVGSGRKGQPTLPPSRLSDDPPHPEYIFLPWRRPTGLRSGQPFCHVSISGQTSV